MGTIRAKFRSVVPKNKVAAFAIAFWVVGLLAAIVYAELFSRPAGVKAVLRNEGATLMRDVHVIVTGRRYGIGDLRPDETRHVYVNPTSESHIKVTFLDETDTPQSLTVGCYIEPGYNGQITIDVAAGKLASVDDRIGEAYY